MAKYEIDGIQYEIDDKLDINETVRQIRLSEDHFKAAIKTGNTVGRAVGENVKGAITAAGDFIAGLPGMVAAAPYGVAESIQRGPKAGLEVFGEISNAMNPLTEEFQYGPLPGIEALTPDRESGAYQNLMKPFEMMSQGYGNIAAQATRPFTNKPETIEQAGAAGELAFGVGMAATIVGGVIKGRRARIKAKEQVTQQKKEAMIQEAQALEQQIAQEKQQAFLEAQQQELPGFGELTKEAEPRTPYNLPESLKAQLEAELNPPVEQRRVGQGELYGELPPVPERLLEPRREPQRPLEYGTEGMPRPTYEGQQALAQGPEALRPGATEPLRMEALEYTRETKPSLGKTLPAVEETTVPAGKPRIFPKQGGVIDPDLLTFGVSRLLERLGSAEKVLEKFKGTFNPNAIADIVHRATQKPDRYNVVWMTPDEFHKLARPRQKDPFMDQGSDILRGSVKQGLRNPLGLDELPSLAIENGKVFHHEGRHRMDVFKEQGMDLIPVQISVAGKGRWPKEIEQEYGSEKVALREPIIKPDLDFTGKRGFRQGGAIKPFASGKSGYEEFKADLKARGIRLPDEAARAIYDKHQQGIKPIEPQAHPQEASVKVASKIDGLRQLQAQYADTRTLEEIGPELKAMKADTLGTQAGLNTIEKIVQGRFTAKGNPLLSWVSSQVHWNKMGATEKANARMHGEKGSRKMPAEGSANFIWNQLGTNSRIAVKDVGYALWNEARDIGKKGIQSKAREVLGRELSEKELQAYFDRNDTLKEVLKDVNTSLKAEGKEPINVLPHYWSPAVFDGPFKVKFLDKDGNTVKVHAAYIKPNIEKLRKAFPEYKLEEVADSSLKGDIDWQQFEWILRQLSKETRDPAAQAITEGLRKMGFGARAFKRKGAKGAMGTEGGERGLKRYEEVYERYVRQAYDFLANRELDKIYQQVNELKDADHLPYTKIYALEAIDAARGGSNKAFEGLSRMVSAAVSGTIAIGTGGKLVLPQRFTRDLLRYGNKVKTTLLLGLGNFVHIGAQLLQAPTFMPPKMLAMAAESGVSPLRIFNAMERATGTFMKWENSVDAQKLRQVGAFEPTFQYDWSTYAADANPQYGRRLVNHLTGVSALIWIESNVVRRPAAHMFLEMLREIGYEKVAKDPLEIYRVAREMTDHYMVSTRFHEKPHIFSRTGLVGMAISPLQSFATTWLGMLREYTSLGAKGLLEGNVAKGLPLAAFIGTSLLTTGMLGAVGIREWDAIANLLNKQFGYNIPTGTEWILSTFKSDKLRFGMLTDAIGWNVGATFGSPSLTGSFAPGVQFLGGVAKLGYDVIRRTGIMGEANQPTDVEMREDFKRVLPRFSPLDVAQQTVMGEVKVPSGWGGIEQLYTPKGAPYQEASGKGGPVTRTPEDWQARMYGTYTTREAREKAEFYTANRRQATLTKHINRAVDLLLKSEVDQKALGRLWTDLAGKKFTADEIRTALRREIMTRMTEADVRGMRQGKTPKQQRLFLLYQNLQQSGYAE